MIQLKNIRLEEDNTVSMDCHVIDQIENQDFSLNFDPETRKIYSDLEGIDPYYAGHAVLHIYLSHLCTMPEKSSEEAKRRVNIETSLLPA